MSFGKQMFLQEMNETLKQFDLCPKVISVAETHHQHICQVFEDIYNEIRAKRLSEQKANATYLLALEGYKHDLRKTKALTSEAIEEVVSASLVSVAEMINNILGFYLVEDGQSSIECF
ncbi:MAG TPA: hypothetical protein PL103_07245 [Saccharofermentans sp.]|nr:hypothetical protein [Saccharofermentans sp.]